MAAFTEVRHRLRPPPLAEQQIGPLVWIGVGLFALAFALATARFSAPPDPFTGAVLVAGVVVATWMAVSVRLEVTLAVFAIYLGLIDGFVKLRTNVDVATLGRDVLLVAVVVSGAARLIGARQPLRLPALTPWILAFTVIVLVEAANPLTAGMTKAAAGIRQQLEFVPLFFFGFALFRTKERLRVLLLLIALIAAVNGIVGGFQSQLSTEQMSAWGPGYEQRINGDGDLAARVYWDDAGDAKIRPFGLGSDMGYAGAVGLVAAPCLLALISLGGGRRRAWPALLMALAVAVGVITSQGRAVLLGTVFAIFIFIVLGVSGRGGARVIGGLAVAAVVLLLVLPAVLPSSDSGSYTRYGSITPSKALNTAYDYRKDDLAYVFDYALKWPFGAGLGTVGPARVFGGAGTSGVNGETQFNFLILEVGIAGLLVWVALALKVMLRVVRRLRRLRDGELRIYLAALAGPFIAVFFSGLGGPTTTAPPYGPYFWLAIGIFAYWFFESHDIYRRPPLWSSRSGGTTDARSPSSG